MTASQHTNWMSEKHERLGDLEWKWQALRDQSWDVEPEEVATAAIPDLAETEREAQQLRAELAVASFVEEVYTLRRTEIGLFAVARADLTAWSRPEVTMEKLVEFVHAEMTDPMLRASKLRWLPPTSRRDADGNWWVELEAECTQAGRVWDRRQYRFHVVQDRVNAWFLLTAEDEEPDTTAI